MKCTHTCIGLIYTHPQVGCVLSMHTHTFSSFHFFLSDCQILRKNNNTRNNLEEWPRPSFPTSLPLQFEILKGSWVLTSRVDRDGGGGGLGLSHHPFPPPAAFFLPPEAGPPDDKKDPGHCLFYSLSGFTFPHKGGSPGPLLEEPTYSGALAAIPSGPPWDRAASLNRGYCRPSNCFWWPFLPPPPGGGLTVSFSVTDWFWAREGGS